MVFEDRKSLVWMQVVINTLHKVHYAHINTTLAHAKSNKKQYEHSRGYLPQRAYFGKTLVAMYLHSHLHKETRVGWGKL